MYSLSEPVVVLVVSEHKDGGGVEGLRERRSRRLLAGVAARRPSDIPRGHDDRVAAGPAAGGHSPVGADVADPEPEALLAVTETRTVDLTSLLAEEIR